MDVCCICLNTNAETEHFVTSCCKNKIHSNCIIQWFIHKGEIDCPLCRSKNIDVKIDDILKFDMHSSNFLLIENKDIYLRNLNKILSVLSGHYVINVIEESENESENVIENVIEIEQNHPKAKYIVYILMYSLLFFIILQLLFKK